MLIGKTPAIKSAPTVITRRLTPVTIVSAIATSFLCLKKDISTRSGEIYSGLFVVRKDVEGRRKKENHGRVERRHGIPFPYPSDGNCEQKLIPHEWARSRRSGRDIRVCQEVNLPLVICGRVIKKYRGHVESTAGSTYWRRKNRSVANFVEH